MAVPSPTVPSFTDGVVLSASALNALGSNITNLWNTSNGGFRTQRDCVIATQTTGQSIANSTDALISFNGAPVNTNNMWSPSSATQITIQTGGIYWLFGQVRYPAIASPTLATVCTANLWLNGTTPGAAIAGTDIPLVSQGAGATPQVGTLRNLAVGAVLYLDAWHTAGVSLSTITGSGGCFLGAILLTPSS